MEIKLGVMVKMGDFSKFSIKLEFRAYLNKVSRDEYWGGFRGPPMVLSTHGVSS